MSIQEHAEQPAKRLDLYLGIAVSLFAVVGMFVAAVSAWNSVNYRIDSLEKRSTAIETSNANEDHQLRVINRNLVKLGAKLGIDMENPE